MAEQERKEKVEGHKGEKRGKGQEDREREMKKTSQSKKGEKEIETMERARKTKG